MKNFRKPHGSGMGKGPQFNRNVSPRPARPGARTRDSYQGATQKFDAICSNCRKSCQVPFRPDGKKPIYCRDCFNAPRDAHVPAKRNVPMGAPSGEGKSIGDLTRQIAAMNAKIDTMLKILEEVSEEDE